MYSTSKNSIQQQSLFSQMCIICLHLTQRFLTIRFFAGLFTGIIFTLIIYHGKEPNDKPKFRADQSKFEYEKNQVSSDDIDLSKTSAWNNSWDRYGEIFFLSIKTFLLVSKEKVHGHDISI
jgi:hypothetical protein